MRNTLLKLSLLAAAVSPLVAHAASFDQLVVNDAGSTYTFVFPAALSASNDLVFSSDFVGVQVTGVQDTTVISGVTTTTTDTVDFGSALAGGGFFDETNNLNLISNLLFNGSSTTPAFTLGSGTGTDGSSPADNVVLSYNLTAYTGPTAPAPEPSSLILLGTGALGVAGSLRRRLFA